MRERDADRFGPTVNFSEDGTPETIHVQVEPPDRTQGYQYLRAEMDLDIAVLAHLSGEWDRNDFRRAVGAIEALPFVSGVEMASAFDLEVSDT